MLPKDWLRPQRRLLAIFLVIVLLPSALLVVSGWRLMVQEEARALQELESRTATAVVSELRRRIAGIDAQLAEPGTAFSLSSPGDDVVFVVFDTDETLATPPKRLLFYPATVAGPEVRFAGLTEVHDFQRVGDVDAALAALTRASAPQHGSVAGLPADLFARFTECHLLHAAGRRGELRIKAAALRTDLYSGTWKLSRTAFEAQESFLNEWLAPTSQPPAVRNARTLSTAVEWLWQQWKAERIPDRAESRHALLALDGGDVTLFWRATPERLAAFVASTTSIESHWLPESRESGRRHHLQISLRHPGVPPPAAKETRQVAAETGLPWTVAVASAASPDTRVTSGRFQIWIAGVALLSLIVVGGAIVIARAAARELAVARLQTDFVAAVSHEFRTPLTSLRQIGEVLHDGRVHSDERRQTYYAALMRQTERLHHLVETLLDFGRMEAGRSPYRREPLDLVSWARSVVDQFNREIEARGYTVELASPEEPIAVLADAQALTNALWNLLDNAVKYSPVCKSIWVTVERSSAAAAVRVRDQGIGVSGDEQRSIFGKFVRGDEAKRQNIPGTGIGLAMVQHIVEAHGGSVHVDSRPGSGSTFTLVIPCRAS